MTSIITPLIDKWPPHSGQPLRAPSESVLRLVKVMLEQRSYLKKRQPFDLTDMRAAQHSRLFVSERGERHLPDDSCECLADTRGGFKVLQGLQKFGSTKVVAL